MEELTSGAIDEAEFAHRTAALYADPSPPLPLFLRSPSPSCPAPSADSSCPDLSSATSPSTPDPSFAESDLASATTALDQMSVDLASPVPLSDVKGKQCAGAVVVEFARQQTPPSGRVVLPLGPGMGRMSTVPPPVERNEEGKPMQDPPSILPGDILMSSLPLAAGFLFLTFRLFRLSTRAIGARMSLQQWPSNAIFGLAKCRVSSAPRNKRGAVSSLDGL